MVGGPCDTAAELRCAGKPGRQRDLACSTPLAVALRCSPAGSLARCCCSLVLLVDGATRSSYSLRRNGVSQLVLGDRGWLDRLTFVLCGLLLLAEPTVLRHCHTRASYWPGRG
ncbi:DUF998 domain-containing protein [Dactylosporangium sp. NPDC051485]|uniref:DUF998 domain-containing protein n=1 Tax=Dactylosporangium sp. NPDC051485 TaxID=3154846 RepID=UPI0034246FE2